MYLEAFKLIKYKDYQSSQFKTYHHSQNQSLSNDCEKKYQQFVQFLISIINIQQMQQSPQKEIIPSMQINAEASTINNQSISPPSQEPLILKHFQIKIQQAIRIKNQGNIQFKAQRYQQAKIYYQNALALLDPNSFYGATEAECVKMAELSANLLFNIGSCFFNEQKWKQSELLYNQAIIVNPFYTKALYKRAVARYEQEQYEGAMKDIKDAFAHDKTNKEIYDYYQKILIRYNESVKKQREKSKQLSEKIFNASRPKQVKKQIEEKQPERGDNNKWWIVALTTLAGVGIYQGLKFLRK